jgi:hypothetical protein
VGLTTQPHLAPRLKEEYSYTSIPLWAFVAFTRVNFTFKFIYMSLKYITFVLNTCVSSVPSYRAACIDSIHGRLTLTIVGGRVQQNVRANMAGACTWPVQSKASMCARCLKRGDCAA